MATGTVKWFNPAKGYGFICADETKQDCFAHFSAIKMEGFRTLREGHRVSFELINGPKGLYADQIELLDVPRAAVSSKVAELSAVASS